MCGVKLRRILPPDFLLVCVLHGFLLTGRHFAQNIIKQSVQFMILPKQVASIRLARKNLEQ
ncbi:hypothetical protein CSR02_11755 [Acetobacter pomorum]|uniref:Uncharacterized protein n=1 Tax=Acetobacter pomorum TaxID=65959 RepID=A0A2G4RAW1_9PROT|nr:hypothetical protein CSR02_11755 [Acetobacter pomorum]